MTANQNDWIVFHRVRFGEPRDGTNAPLPGPESAACWRFYPASPIGEDGMRTNVAADWGGFGLYETQAAAQAVYDAPQDHLPFLADAVEAWHALVLPYAHRGEVNWRGQVRDGTSIAPGRDPGGPLVVLTSAGYDAPGPDDLPRIQSFLQGVQRVQDYYSDLPGNIRQAVFSGTGVDGHDGMTFSLWKDDAAMMAAAYKPGQHKDEMSYHVDHSHFDRSSFTRARIMGSKGAWDGVDPVTAMG